MLCAGPISALIVAHVFRRTVWGFELLATGTGPKAARVSGRIRVNRVVAFALLWSGLLAGLTGGVEVSGVSYALFQNLSPGYGFSGIAVALLARLQPLAIVVTGVLFGALEAGAAAMQRDAGVPGVRAWRKRFRPVGRRGAGGGRRIARGCGVRRVCRGGGGQSDRRGHGNNPRLRRAHGHDLPSSVWDRRSGRLPSDASGRSRCRT